MINNEVLAVEHEGLCCACCALKISNDDGTACRDYYLHEQHDPKPERIAAGQVVITDEHGELDGACELCGLDNGKVTAHWYAIVADKINNNND